MKILLFRVTNNSKLSHNDFLSPDKLNKHDKLSTVLFKIINVFVILTVTIRSGSLQWPRIQKMASKGCQFCVSRVTSGQTGSEKFVLCAVYWCSIVAVKIMGFYTWQWLQEKINLEELSLFACFKFGSSPSFRLAISLFFQEKFCENPPTIYIKNLLEHIQKYLVPAGSKLDATLTP